MDVAFRTNDLRRLWADRSYNGGFSVDIVRAYRKRVQVIIAALDERDLRAVRANHFEKLKGARAHQCSVRLNDQWRLVLEIEDQGTGTIVRVVEIQDYH